jgi:hypothetical protein
MDQVCAHSEYRRAVLGLQSMRGPDALRWYSTLTCKVRYCGRWRRVVLSRTTRSVDSMVLVKSCGSPSLSHFCS